MLSILERFTDEPTQTVHQRNATGMLAALADTGRHVYLGTVPAATVATRRRRNRAARRARRAARR
jgi:5,10-methylenetetrahydrofolate reductase